MYSGTRLGNDHPQLASNFGRYCNVKESPPSLALTLPLNRCVDGALC